MKQPFQSSKPLSCICPAGIKPYVGVRKQAAVLSKKLWRDHRANAGDKDKKERQSTGKSNRLATTSKEQPSHAGATGAFREAQWISNTKEDPEQLHILSLSMGTAFGNSCHGMRSHHLHLHRRHSALLSWPPELYRVVQKRMQLKKRKVNISFSVLECGCLHSWSIFGRIYKI